MLARLQASTTTMERALHATRRFAADAGHELRTPLTGLRANLDTLARNPDLDAAERAALVRRHGRRAGADRAPARGAAGAGPRRGGRDASRARTSSSATSSTRRVFAARRRHPGVTYELDDAIDDAAVHGWDGGLRLLVDNLLDNAALHGRAGGHVRVALARDDDDLLVRVDDDGPGIARRRARAPARAVRARDGRRPAPGTGLGLAIVAQQVALHDGELRLGDSELGGLAVEVRLPATAAIAAIRPITSG